MKRKSIVFFILVFTSSITFAQVTGITPNIGNRGQTLPIIISGNTGDFSTQGSGTSYFLRQGSLALFAGTVTSSQGSGTSQGSAIFKNSFLKSSSEIQTDFSIPLNAPLGYYDIVVVNRSQQVPIVFTTINVFEITQGSSTNIVLAVGGGQPGETVTEVVTWQNIDMTGLLIDQMWLSKNGNTITTLTNAQVVFKNSGTQVDIDIPIDAELGYWNVNIVMSNGDTYMSPGGFYINPLFTVRENPYKDIHYSVYPNPGKDQVSIEFNSPVTELATVVLYNNNGQILMERSMAPNQLKYNLNTAHLNSGLYYVQVNINGHIVSTSKWLKN